MGAYFDKNRVKILIELLAPTRKTRIVDVGSNPINGCIYKELLDIGGCEVWGFEPQPDAFAKLLEQQGDNEHYLPYAIGDGSEAQLNICRSDGFSSLFKPDIKVLDYLNRWHKAMTVVETVPIKTKRLDELEELPKPDLLKIDVQGSEVAVFENGQKTLSETVAVISEVAFIPIYANQPLVHNQMSALEKQNFLLSKFMFLKPKSINTPLMAEMQWRRHQNQLIDGDAVFIRNLVDADTYSDEQLKHQAICADSIFESFDLTLKCLDILLLREKIDKKAVTEYMLALPFRRDA